MALTDHKGNLDQKTGNFLPGNTWKMPPWRKGQSGHTARYQPNSIVTKCTEYIEQQDEADKPITWSGLALHMGMSRPALDKYAQGKIGKDTAGIVSVLEYMRTVIESRLEHQVTSKEYSTVGVLARLRTIDERWQDTKNVNVDVQETQQIQIMLDPKSELAKRLGTNSSVIIEGEVTDDS